MRLERLQRLWAEFLGQAGPLVPTHQPERGAGERRKEYDVRRRNSKRAAQASMLSGPFNPNPRRPF